MSARSQFLRFAAVGVAGFVVDATVLFLVMLLGTGPFVGRVFSYFAAATFTWAANRRITFGDRSTGLMAQWARFLAVNAFGGLVNYAVYAALVLSFELFAAWPTFAVGFGALAGLVFNYALSRRLVFGRNGAAAPR